MEDLESVDLPCFNRLEALREVEKDGILSEEDFRETYRGIVWTTNRSDGVEVEITAGGREKAVTMETREDYCAAVEKFRLNEAVPAVAAIKRGLETIVPIRLLTMYTWKELEIMVCGRPEIDIGLLKTHTVSPSFFPLHEKDQPDL